MVVTAGAELIVFDIQTPSAPIELGRALVQHPAEYVAVSDDGQLASVSDSSDNVTMVDISDREAPVARGSYAWPGLEQPRIMAFRGEHLFVGVRTVGLMVLDISDPDAPMYVASVDGSVSDFVLGLALLGDYAYLGQRGPTVWWLRTSATLPRRMWWVDYLWRQGRDASILSAIADTCPEAGRGWIFSICPTRARRW